LRFFFRGARRIEAPGAASSAISWRMILPRKRLWRLSCGKTVAAFSIML
jgi:hypothetical protein